MGEAEFNSVTKREGEILLLIAGGLKSSQIAKHLCLSLRTVEWHRANIIEKLRLNGAMHLSIAAHEYTKLKEQMEKKKKGKN